MIDYARREEGEQRDGDAGADRANGVLETFADGVLFGCPARHGHGQAEEHSGHRRVHSGRMYENPRSEGKREEQPPRRDPSLGQPGERGKRHHGTNQRPHRQLGRINHSDDHDRDQVVDDGERQEEGPQRTRQMSADDGEYSQGEGNIGRGRDRPAGAQLRPRADDGKVDQRRNDDSARGGDHRQDGLADVTQIPDDEFSLEFEARDEEEDGE